MLWAHRFSIWGLREVISPSSEENSYCWVISYLAVVNGLGVAVPLDKELTSDDIARLIEKSDTDTVVCSETYLPIISDILVSNPNIKNCIVMNASRPHEGLLDMNELISNGYEALNNGDLAYTRLPIDTDAMCEILYTSGTTGANKGVMLSQKNITSVVYGVMHLIKTTPVSFSVLPISHSYECTCHILGGIYSGITNCFNDSPKHVLQNLAVFQPSMSLMVPLFLESIQRNIWEEARKANLVNHLKYGMYVSNLLRKIGIDKRKLFFKPILSRFGGNLEQVVCGGAPLRDDLIKFFDSLGVNIVNGYGITECAPVISTNSTAWKKIGSVGKIIPVCNVRIANPDNEGYGEVQVQGDIVMLGYYKDQKSTKATFSEDGWFKTGDLGRLDKRNFLYLSGRKKNLIILANGKNVCPEELEQEITSQLPYVKEVMVYASGSGIYKQESINADVYLYDDYFETDDISEIQDKLNKDIKKLNAKLSVYKRINKVHIRTNEFEKTTTKKIKRQVALEGRLFNA